MSSGQRRCQIAHHTQDSSTTKNYRAQNVRGAEAETPDLNKAKTAGADLTSERKVSQQPFLYLPCGLGLWSPRLYKEIITPPGLRGALTHTEGKEKQRELVKQRWPCFGVATTDWSWILCDTEDVNSLMPGS